MPLGGDRYRARRIESIGAFSLQSGTSSFSSLSTAESIEIEDRDLVEEEKGTSLPRFDPHIRIIVVVRPS